MNYHRTIRKYLNKYIRAQHWPQSRSPSHNCYIKWRRYWRRGDTRWLMPTAQLTQSVILGRVRYRSRTEMDVSKRISARVLCLDPLFVFCLVLPFSIGPKRILSFTYFFIYFFLLIIVDNSSGINYGGQSQRGSVPPWATSGFILDLV